jgi:uncharacterized repeat protein (TIGR03847 family)
MAEETEFDPADRVAVGTVGPAGKRAFFIQVANPLKTLTMLVEKVQVRALSERVLEILEDHDTGRPEAPADLDPPIDPDWRAGQMGIGMDEERRMLVLVAQEAPEDEETDPATLDTLRAWARPAQMLAFAHRGLELCNAGRPLCPLCGLPMEPEGHHCPRKNGKSPVF